MPKETFLLFVGLCEIKESLIDKELLWNVLKKLPELIQMKGISDPMITVAVNNPGLEGYVPIDTSNITLSTYTNNSRIVGCIHSCREFDRNVVIAYIKEQYECTRVAHRHVTDDDMDGDTIL